ncbi:hypothetical protein [Pseudomonas sp. SLFW]|uniref:hypothetical protein n=1 Tax=Pseudomonas sp. SLFW TaxID=2683259 RepID=UPI001413351C|nr:hypothetical protein [Pseudomonas sp. SLFW]NBB10788.1 hypothetical protein [Pseudomonas sp. SLFW]
MMTQDIVETYLNDGVLMMFAAPVDQAFKRDVMDSSLYAQLAAGKQFDRFTHYREWQTTLLKAMTTFGWLRLDLSDKHGITDETFVVADRLRELLPDSFAFLRGKKLDTFLASLCVTHASKIAQVMVAQDAQVAASPSGSKAGNASCAEPVSSVVLQVAFVLPSRQKVLLCVAFETLEPVAANPFAQRLTKSRLVGEVRSFGFVGTLDDLRYAQFRERVDAALAGKRAGLSHAIQEVEP